MVLGYFWGFKRALKNSKVKHLRTYLIVLPLYKKNWDHCFCIVNLKSRVSRYLETATAKLEKSMSKSSNLCLSNFVVTQPDLSL